MNCEHGRGGTEPNVGESYGFNPSCVLCWKQRAEKAESELTDLLAQFRRKRTELVNVYEAKKKAEAACAEMREAYKSFECTICDENHKFSPECNACLSGQPTACTCDREEKVDCPCCMEGEYAEGYRKLRHALSSDCGVGWLSPEQKKVLIEALNRIVASGGPSGGFNTYDLADMAQKALAAVEGK